jgi:hypothetical protein
MTNFGLEGYKLGVFLISFNLVIFCLSLWYAWSKYQQQHQEEQVKEHMVGYHFFVLSTIVNILVFKFGIALQN